MVDRSSKDYLALSNRNPASCSGAEIEELSVGFFDVEGLAVDLRGHLSLSSFALILYRMIWTGCQHLIPDTRNMVTAL